MPERVEKSEYRSSGNYVVDRMKDLNIKGNIVNSEWCRKIRFPDGKPDLISVMILSEIVYWYRPREMCDNSGNLVALEKRFAADMLQKSCAEFVEKFGFSDKQVRRALSALERQGLIRRELRTVKIGGRLMNNVMYIAPVPERLEELSKEEASLPGSTEPLYPEGESLLTSPQEGLYPEGETNTKNTPKNTNKENNDHINSGMVAAELVNKVADMREEEMAYREMISENIEYGLTREALTSDEECACYDEIYELICDTVCHAEGNIRIGGNDVPAEVVKGVFCKLNKEHIAWVMESMKKRSGEIRNMRAYLLTVLYRANQTMYSSRQWAKGNNGNTEVDGDSYRLWKQPCRSSWDIQGEPIDYDLLVNNRG